MTQIYSRFADLFDTLQKAFLAILAGFFLILLGIVKFFWPGVMKL
jgi:hypothetical protein